MTEPRKPSTRKPTPKAPDHVPVPMQNEPFRPEGDRPPAQRRTTRSIKNLTLGLPERGKIKIGRKGNAVQSRKGNTFQPPQKLDHFIVTTTERDQTGNFKRDEAIHRDILGGDPKPVEIPITLIYDDPDLNFPTRYAAMVGRTLWCSGDGETAQRLEDSRAQTTVTVACPCHRQEPEYTGNDKCKINGNLSVIIRGAESIGGVWKFRTTSYNSVQGILSAMELFRRMTGGVLAGLPLWLRVNPKTVTTPGTQDQQTVYVVSLEFKGATEELQRMGMQIAERNAIQGVRIERIEEEARRLLEHSDPVLPPHEIEDVAEEYYADELDDDPTEDLSDVPSERPSRDKPAPEPEPEAEAEPEPEPEGDESLADIPGEIDPPEGEEDVTVYVELIDEVGEAIQIPEHEFGERLLSMLRAYSRRPDAFAQLWENNVAALEEIRAANPQADFGDLYHYRNTTQEAFDRAKAAAAAPPPKPEPEPEKKAAAPLPTKERQEYLLEQYDIRLRAVQRSQSLSGLNDFMASQGKVLAMLHKEAPHLYDKLKVAEEKRKEHLQAKR